ncbi:MULTISPECIES: hypothetical protein [Nostocales]|uniref:Uncharacterized protein n=3 Tax=Nostocales TaxID=1161 RepID=A0A0C1QT06_9CYAN|nr:hypothetical protein [Tolypothrix bouteillei]KAF3889622.1 hypothetical protein DA73_0400032230 [Tolypothrix bouteillei VB521301]
MKTQQKLDEITLYLTQTLSEYEVIPANWGWHIHKKDMYCGLLEYQDKKGWRGSAFNSLPARVKEKLKQFALSNFALTYQVMV